MMLLKSKKWWMPSVLFFLLAVGCGHQGEKQVPASTGIDRSFSGNSADHNAEKIFTITIFPDAPRAGDVLTAVVRGVGGPLVFSWGKNGELLEGQHRTRLSLPGLVRGDVVRVVVTAGEKEAVAETAICNSPPEVESVVFKTPYLCRGVDFEVEARGRDADGDPVEFRYVWEVDGRELFYETGAVLPGDSYEKGNIVKLTVIPRDEIEEGNPFGNGLEFEVRNAPPRIVSSPPETLDSLEYRYQVRAVDADEDEVSYELAKGPEGMTIDPENGLVRWSIPPDASGTHEVRIEARDAGGMTGWQEYTLEIKVGNQDPGKPVMGRG
jgi:hypothetical protein